MTFAELPELHNINHVQNVASILERGILSHESAKKIPHQSVAMAEIQDIRARVVVPRVNRKLHAYANLYINARNKMMYKRKDQHRELCVVRVDKTILQNPSAVVADQNACTNYVRFGSGIDGLKLIDKDMVFAQYWNHPGDQIASWRHGAAMCAEVLILDCVQPAYIKGVYVSCEQTKSDIQTMFPNLDVVVNGYLFFQ